MLCRRKFKTWSELTTHSKEEHGEQKEFECKVCREMQNTASRHRKHMVSHEEDKLKFKCDICGRKFPYQCYLKQHLNVHSDEKPYSCPAWACSFTCKLKQSLNHHMVVHSGIDFSCTVCSKRFMQKHYLTVHFNNTHGKVKPCQFYWNGCTFANKHRNILNPCENTCAFNPMKD